MEFHLRSIGQPCSITFTTSVWKLTTGLWISRCWLPCWKYLKMHVMFHCNIILMTLRMHLFKNRATYRISKNIYIYMCICSTDLWYILRLMLETSTITVNPLASQRILHVDVFSQTSNYFMHAGVHSGVDPILYTYVLTYVPRVYDAQYTEICARHPYHQYTTH